MDQVRAFFDLVGDAEWDRHDADPRSRVAFEVHSRFLREWVSAGDRVLEIGAGPGRFTAELAAIGTRIVVTDLSPVQLAANEARVAHDAVEDRRVVDICDLSDFADESFDIVLAYGGPLSYVFDDAPTALGECLRVTRPGGHVVMSVMSNLGTMRFFLPDVVIELGRNTLDTLDYVYRSGDTRPVAANGHVCRMFRWHELTEMFDAFACEVAGASASNCISLGDQATVQTLADEPELWARFVEWEIAACREPGALDSGTHILFALRRPAR